MKNVTKAMIAEVVMTYGSMCQISVDLLRIAVQLTVVIDNVCQSSTTFLDR